MKVTVIATNFPTDMPRKSLFSGAQSGQTLLKEENAAMAKKEITNSIKSGSNEYLKKTDKKSEIEDIIVDDDTDDWSAVPAFLRRKK